MQYAEYRKKMVKLANVLSVLKRFRVLIISVCLLIVALITTLLCIRGIVYEVSDCPQSIVYGENLGFKAKAVMGGVVYRYSADGGEKWSETEPVRAGEYMVRPCSKSITGKPRYGKTHAFAILPKETEVRAADTAVYGDDPALIADLSFSDRVTCSKFIYGDKYAENTSVLPDKDSVVITDKNGADVTSSYIITTVKTDITIGRRAVTVAAESAEKEYDGTPLTAGGYDLRQTTLAYGDRISFNGCEGSVTDAGNAQNSIVGEIKIYNEENADVTGRYDVTKSYGTLTVNRRKVTVNSGSVEKEYDGEPMYCAEFSDDGRLIAGHSLRVSSLTRITDAGEKDNALGFTVKNVYGKDMTANYEILLNAGKLTVTRRKVTVTTEDMSWVYDGTAHSYAEYYDTLGTVADNEEIRVASAASITDVGSAENVCEMRAYNYKTNTEVTENYEITVLYGTLTVKAAKLTIKSQDRGWVYDGTAHDCNGYSQSGLSPLHTITPEAVSAITEVGACPNVIRVKVYAGNTEVTSNYQIEYFWGTLEITRRPVTVSADDAEKIYDGTPLTCGTVSGDNLAAGHTVTGITYGSGTDAAEYVNRITEGTVKICDASGKDVTANYIIAIADGTLTVKPRPITVETGDREWVYDGETHYYATYKITSAADFALVAGHVAAVESYTEICDAGEKENALTIKIYSGGDDVTANYDITYENGTLTVNPRPITIATESDSKIYDGTALTCEKYKLASTVQALVKGHYIDVTFTGAQTDAGDGKNTVQVKILSAADGDKTANYKVTVNEGTLTVTKRPVTVISLGGEWVYDGEPHMRTAFDIFENKGMGLADGQVAELASYTSITDAGSKKNIITVNVIAGGKAVTANYEISYEYGTLTVTPRPLVVTADSAKKQYDGTPLTCGTVSGNNTVHGHKVTARTLGSQTAVGESLNRVVEGSVTLSDADGNDVTKNYSVTYATGILKVVPREITVKAGDAQKVYDGDPLTCPLYSVVSENKLLPGHVLTAVTSGSRTDAGESGNTVLPSGVKIADRYGIDVTGNYALSFEDGLLTVLPRTITVTAADAEKEYDGTPLTCSDFGVTSEYDPALVKDHKLTAVITGSRTDAGVSANVVESVTITSAGGDVTANYSIIAKNGELSVTGKKLTVTTADGEWVYDGGDRYLDDFVYDGLIQGHTISRKEIEAFKNAGSYENKLTVCIFSGEDDVTENYSITYVYGTITVNKREVHLTTANGEWVYDNVAYSAPSAETDGDSPYNLVPGHALSYTQATEITNVGEAENKVTVSVLYGEKDETANYDLHLTYGTLKVTKRPVTLTYKYDGIYFTGAPLNNTITTSNYFVSVSEYPLPSGTQVTLTVLCDGYGIGAATLYFKEGSAKITDYNNTDLTANFEISLLSKQVNIEKREIRVYSSDAEKVYDGTPLTCEDYEVRKTHSPNYPFVSYATVDGHKLELEATFTGAITQIGEAANSFTVDGFKVTDGAGDDITYGYTVKEYFGNLYVTEFGSLYVETSGASKIYDGTPLTNGHYSVTSTLLDGYTYEITVTGSRTEVGASANTFEVTVYSPQGENVTAGLRLVSNPGTLWVHDKDYEGGSGAGDIDLSGGIGGGGGSGGSDGEQAVALKVYSEAGGRVYMRLISYGAYNGTGWSPANPYTQTVDGKYGMNYLTGFALGGAGLKSVNMKIEVMGSYYYLPYYLASGDYGYKIQQSDVLYTGDTSAVYSLKYYPYDYLQSGAVKLYMQDLTAAEQEYRQFVYDNYLTVPEDTAEYLKTVISAQGFDINDGALVAKIAAFVQNAAAYNLYYDTALDSESDMAVSFLRDYREGVCRHYASAATLLYRMMGIPARYTVGYTGETKAGEWIEITTQNAHAWVEIYVDGMGWVQIEVTGSGESEYGEIDLGEITPADITKEYDGTPLMANRIAEQGKLAELLKEGFTYSAQFGGSRTDVGTGESRVTGITLYSPDGKPVVRDVIWTSGKGKLTVVPSGTLITVHLYYLSCEYDGRGHSLGSNDWYAEGLPKGYRMEFDPSSVTVTNAGGFDRNEIKALPLKLYNASGYDVTGNYNIIFSFESEQGGAGEGIDINRRLLVVSTQTAEKEYDGKPLENGEWWISFGTLADGHRIEVEVVGSITEAGETENSVGSCEIYDRDGNDVSANYEVVIKCGTLTVID